MPGLILFMTYRMRLSNSKCACMRLCVRACMCVCTRSCVCVCEPRKAESSRSQAEKTLESLEVADLLEERNPDTPYPGPRAGIGGIYSKWYKRWSAVTVYGRQRRDHHPTNASPLP